MLKQWNIALVTVLLTAFGLNAASELVLVKDGISHAPIVVYADAPPMTRQAADELAEYIERISGARPEVIVGRPDPLPKHAIWVGVQPAFTYRYHPQLRSRAGVFTYSRQGDGVGYGRSGKWCHLQRLQLDSLDVHPGGHGFGMWWNRFHETHPEYFALQPDGTRAGGDTPFPGASTVKMCLSNPGLWEQWLQTNVDDVLQDDPLRVVFDASENDSWASGYCICENCRRWDCPDAELRIFRWEGIGQQHVAMSDRQVTFANHLGHMLRQRYPDKDYYVRSTTQS